MWFKSQFSNNLKSCLGKYLSNSVWHLCIGMLLSVREFWVRVPRKVLLHIHGTFLDYSWYFKKKYHLKKIYWTIRAFVIGKTHHNAFPPSYHLRFSLDGIQAILSSEWPLIWGYFSFRQRRQIPVVVSVELVSQRKFSSAHFPAWPPQASSGMLARPKRVNEYRETRRKHTVDWSSHNC